MLMDVVMKINIPEGYEATGEYRKATPGEWYLMNGIPTLCERNSYMDYPIIHPKPRIPKPGEIWRNSDGINGLIGQIDSITRVWVPFNGERVIYFCPGGDTYILVKEFTFVGKTLC